MSGLPIHSGMPWSPYFVFIKDIAVTDREILTALGLTTYVRLPSFNRLFDYLAIGRDKQWTHLADNFRHSHWFSERFKDAVSRLGASVELFSFSVGDIDVSFDFDYYRAGKLHRRFVWEDRYNSGGRLKEQIGAPLDQEDTVPCGQDALSGLWRVAAALGIESDYTRLDLRFYAPKPKQRERRTPQ